MKKRDLDDDRPGGGSGGLGRTSDGSRTLRNRALVAGGIIILGVLLAVFAT